MAVRRVHPHKVQENRRLFLEAAVRVKPEVLTSLERDVYPLYTEEILRFVEKQCHLPPADGQPLGRFVPQLDPRPWIHGKVTGGEGFRSALDDWGRSHNLNDEWIEIAASATLAAWRTGRWPVTSGWADDISVHSLEMRDMILVGPLDGIPTGIWGVPLVLGLPNTADSWESYVQRSLQAVRRTLTHCRPMLQRKHPNLQPPINRKRGPKRADGHLVWLARFQVGEETQADIARTLKQEGEPLDRVENRVKKALSSAARRINLTRRRAKPRRPRG